MFCRCCPELKGVGWYPRDKQWRARIGVNSGSMYLGYFYNELEAAKAYDEAAKKYHGEYANLNFP